MLQMIDKIENIKKRGRGWRFESLIFIFLSAGVNSNFASKITVQGARYPECTYILKHPILTNKKQPL